MFRLLGNTYDGSVTYAETYSIFCSVTRTRGDEPWVSGEVEI